MRGDSIHEEIIEKMTEKRIDERFERMKLELCAELAHWRQAGSAAAVANDAFNRQQSYISTLVQVQSVDHNVHKELDDAIARLKGLTYQS